MAAPWLCLVSSRRALSPEARTVAEELAALERFLDQAIGAGVDLIQVREPDLEARVLERFVAGVAKRADGTGVRVVVNDRLDVALAASAAGVHLRSDGPPPVRVRDVCPPGFAIGRSVHSAAETAGLAEHVDYLLFGTVFESRSKRAGSPVAGLDELRRAVAATPAPVLAIGGITPARARACLETGAAGVAAIGVFLPEGRAAGGLGVERAVRELRAAAWI
jgi:thiamine-phosphate pyrophosphorylase